MELRHRAPQPGAVARGGPGTIGIEGAPPDSVLTGSVRDLRWPLVGQ